jgi:hypothetical protein
MATMIISGNKNNAEVAYDVLLKMAGGADKYSQNTLGAIWMECLRNKELQHLSGMYLAGSSERAEKNLKALRMKLIEVFLENN